MDRPLQIGVLCETKATPDRRVAITPQAARTLLADYPEIGLTVQNCPNRSFRNEEYDEQGIALAEDISGADVLFGVKEVKLEMLIPEKTYFFFAHVGKKQPHNQRLLQEIIKRKITLIDYEYLTRFDGARVVAFGHWAGVVGAYNGLRAEGIKSHAFHLKPAHQYISLQAMYTDLQKIKLRPVKILLTGGGRVAVGAIQTLSVLKIKEVSPEEFLNNEFREPVFCRLDPWHYVKPKDNRFFELQHFIHFPEQYESTFRSFTEVADIYMSCHFWDPRSPVFISKMDMRKPDFKISVIADISCDVNGPIYSTRRASTIAEPFYDYNPFTSRIEKPFSKPENITVIAIDNLPGELPRDASEDFSQAILTYVIPRLLGSDDGMLQRATIVDKGNLSLQFEYLREFAEASLPE
jgi:saccharopine dehydrogenase (NAD+, L-lysine forming)